MTTSTITERYEVARRTLADVNQVHVLHFYDRLDESQRERLLEQVAEVDWPEVARLVESHVRRKPEFKLPENLEPAPWYPYDPPRGQKDKYKKARKHGEKLVRDGRVAAFTVAGGQGTRLGWDGPKGTFPATAIRKDSLLQSMAEYIRKTQKKYKAVVPWYIMTSPINDGPTRAFFDEHGYFGLDPANVKMFPQGMMPAIDADTGKVLLESPDTIAMSPNGHGGSLKALYTSGAIEDMKDRGIEQISYTQVDNPIVRIIDPQFLGLHALDQCQMSSKMLPKAYPKEKLGNFCLVDGKMTVIEYSDLPDEYAEQRTDDGELRFKAGSIAIHAIRVDFVESLNTSADGFGLPYHRADKKVEHIDIETEKLVKPEANNAVKLETFVFDALPLTNRSIIYETDRTDEFAPIKNADAKPGEPPAVDCPATSRRIQTERAARWLEGFGVTVPRDDDGAAQAVIEITHLTAIEPTDLKTIDLPDTIVAGTEVLL